jgi:hypothetical protein
MTSDDRITSDFIHDIVDAPGRHGHARSDDLHAGHAIGLTADLAHSCEGTQDAPPGGSVVVPSSRPAAPQPPGPAGQDAVTVSAGQVRTLLAALDDAAGYTRDRAQTCADCAGQSCTTCQWPLQAAEAYDQMAGQMIHAAEAPAAWAARPRPPSTSRRRPARGRRQGGRAGTRHRTDRAPCRTGRPRQVAA